MIKTEDEDDRLTQQASDRIISVAQTATVGGSQRGIQHARRPIHHVELMTASLGKIQDFKGQTPQLRASNKTMDPGVTLTSKVLGHLPRNWLRQSWLVNSSCWIYSTHDGGKEELICVFTPYTAFFSASRRNLFLHIMHTLFLAL